MHFNNSLTELHIPFASLQAGYMADIPTCYPLSSSHWSAGTGIQTFSIVIIYPIYNFRCNTAVPWCQHYLSYSAPHWVIHKDWCNFGKYVTSVIICIQINIGALHMLY